MCSVKGCERQSHARGWCNMHYQRVLRIGHPGEVGPIDLRVRWQRRIEVVPNGCWLWTGKRSDVGYGLIKMNGRTRLAHRVAWMLLRGEIPAGLDLDHMCHNQDDGCAGGVSCSHRACVNPDHLAPATRSENLRRGNGIIADQVRRTHCPTGHPYAGDNLYVSPRGIRQCRTCRAERRRAA